MSRDVTFSWAAECGAKKPYLSKRAAKHAARWAETLLGGGHLRPYRCSWAAGNPHWHVGHKPAQAAVLDAIQQLATRHRRSELSTQGDSL